MQVGDRVLVLADTVPGVGIGVPDHTYGTVEATDSPEGTGEGAKVELDDGESWWFGQDELEVVGRA